MVLAVLGDGSLFVGRGFAGCANQNRDFHIQLSRRPSQRLRPQPN
jgi:hypothetical protein